MIGSFLVRKCRLESAERQPENGQSAANYMYESTTVINDVFKCIHMYEYSLMFQVVSSLKNTSRTLNCKCLVTLNFNLLFTVIDDC